jgi:hypothetical protein
MQLCKPKQTRRSAKAGRILSTLKKDCELYNYRCSPAGRRHHNMVGMVNMVNNQGGMRWEAQGLLRPRKIRMEDHMRMEIEEIMETLDQEDTVKVARVQCHPELLLQTLGRSNQCPKRGPTSQNSVGLIALHENTYNL